ncbi:MAG: hypothetical protein LBM66_05040 [Bifidobacteriaceae bacterium]|jgi:antitoxin (DNA-binding transcriptional repressor) of toxin-antitoxin stability system|nr:hypothetical protein [Bifidobacteriaceae bacterium]
MVVNMLEAKSTLSQLVAALEAGEESEIVIARRGRPAARLTALAGTGSVARRIGVARGRFTVPDDFGRDDDAIADLFTGDAETIEPRTPAA